MRFLDTDRWNEIWQTIARNKKRSIMTALGVFWGIFMLVVMLGAGQGLERISRAAAGGIAINTLMVQPVQTSIPYKGMPSNRWWMLDNDDLEAVRKLDEVTYVAANLWGGMQYCSYNEHKGEYNMMGFTPDFQHINPQKILKGRFINEIDILQKRKVCIIGEQVWKDLFASDEGVIGKMLLMNGTYFTVIGVVRRQSNFVSFGEGEQTVGIPASLMQQMFGMGKRIHMMTVAGRDDVSSSQLEEAVKKVVFARHIISPDDKKAAWTMSVADFVNKMKGLFNGVALLTWVVGLGTLLAGIVGVSNIMLVLVKERTQEIGIRRAIGASPRSIIAQILSESFALTLTAGIFGLSAGVWVLSVADSIPGLKPDGIDVPIQIGFSTGVIALAILVAGSLLAGIIPAVRALSIKAVDAIREE